MIGLIAGAFAWAYNDPWIAVWTIVVDPLVADEKKVPETLDAYAKDKLVAEWKDVFADKTRRYYVVARGVKRDVIEKIKKEELPGVWYSKGNARVYAEGQMASSLLGFVNADGKGQYGALLKRCPTVGGLRSYDDHPQKQGA